MSKIQEKIFTDMLARIAMEKNDKLIHKALEIDGLVKAKSSEVVKHLNENFKTLLCLDISCELLNIPFNTTQAIIHSAVKKKVYSNNRKMLLKILNLDKKMDISDVILKLGILQSVSLEKTAQKIFEHYRREQTYSDEISHPSVVAMCVYYAAKIEKLKIVKKTILGISNLSSAQWSTMEKDWSSWALNVDLKKKRSNKENLSEVLKEQEKQNCTEKAAAPPIKRHYGDEEESYDDWAKRILDKAHAELKVKQVKT